MRVTTDEVMKMARLSRIHVEEDELDEMAGAMTRVVEMFNELSEVNTEGIEPLVHPSRESGVYGAGEVRGTLSRERALEIAPAHDGEHFLVPRVL